MIPAEFSVKGPHGKTPWVASWVASSRQMMADGSFDSVAKVNIMLIWARSQQIVTQMVMAHHGKSRSRPDGLVDEDDIQIKRVDPNHHLGTSGVALNWSF